MPDPLSTTTHDQRWANCCAAASRSICTCATAQPSKRAASKGCGVITVAKPALALRASRVCRALSWAMALSASASSTNWDDRDSTLGKCGRTASPPPHPHTTVCAKLVLVSSAMVMRLGYWVCTPARAWGLSKPKNTLPAPPCNAASPAKMAAPVMPGAPPKTNTWPWLPLWLWWALGLSEAGEINQASGGCDGPAGWARSSNHTSPDASLPWWVNKPGLRVSKLKVANGKTRWGLDAGPNHWPLSDIRPVGTSTHSNWLGAWRNSCKCCCNRPSGGRSWPSPNKASMPKSHSVGA